MALKASGFAGTAKLHDLTAGGEYLCDLCGNEVDSEVADAVALDCSFAQCDPESSCYHTHCLEKFLKSMKCERNRKIGFPCPRGCGKGTKFKDACRGKILKSHPVTIRSEANKKRRQAELEQLAQQTAARDKAARKKEEDVRAATAAKAGKAKDKDKEKGKAAAKASPTIKALNVANTAITSAGPPKTQAQLQKEQLAATATKLKSQILARTSSTASSASSAATTAAAATASTAKLVTATSGRLSAVGSVGGKKEVKTLDEYLAERGGASALALERSSSVASSAAPLASAWGKSRASSASSLEAAELAEAAAAASAAAPAPAPAVAPEMSSEEAFPPSAATGPGKPPRPPPAPSAAATGPAPAPAAAQPQGVWAQKPAVAVVTAPPPPPPRGPPAAPATAAAAASAKAKGAATAAAAPAEDAKLSRAQRKNQRRAEKKAAAAAAVEAEACSHNAASSSPLDSQPTSPQAPGGSGHDEASTSGSGPAPAGCSESFERCMQALVQHKLQSLVEQLQAVGFPAGAALAAVQQHGGNLEGALVTLLEQATGVQDSMHSLGLAASAGPAEVDLTEELQQMQELQARYGLPPGTVEMLAVEHQGDLDSLAASLLQQQQAMLAYAGSSGIADLQQPQHGQGLHAASAPSPTEPPSPVVSGSSLFGTLAPSADSGQSYSADSWGQRQGQSCYSAFGFGGFAEAALHAVHGGSLAQGGVLLGADAGGMSTPTSRDRASSLGGAGIWGSNAASVGGTAGTGAYATSDTHLPSLLSIPNGSTLGTSGAGGLASSSGFGVLGAFDPLQPSSTQPILDPRPQHSAASTASFLSAFPVGGSLLQQLGGSSWQPGEGLGHLQQPLSSLPPCSGAGSGLGGLGAGAAGPDDRSLLVR